MAARRRGTRDAARRCMAITRAGDAIPSKPTADREIARARTWARVLDNYLVDPLLGLLLPGVGDILGAILGLYVVAIAARRKVSPVVVMRMVMNLVLDAMIGALPLIGDIYDFEFKANLRNVALLERCGAAGGRASRRDWAIVIGAGLVFVAIFGLIIFGVVELVRALARE
jgi:hypothetical protein